MDDRTTDPAADVKAIADGATELALRLFAADPSPENAVYSPMSLVTALTMTHAGAKDETAKELAGLLGITDLGSPRADAALAELERQVQQSAKNRPADRTMTLETANRAWVTEEANIRGEFATILKVHYHSAVGRLNSGKPDEAAKTVNDWIKDRTRGLIPKVIEPSNITPGGLILTNAIYFKARWAETFSISATKPGPFSLATGKVVEVPMMNQVERFAYGEATITAAGRPIKVQMCALPYEGGAEAVLIVPDSPDGLNMLSKGFESAETCEQMSLALGTLSDRRVDLTMPKFTIERTGSVAGSLRKLGVERAFTDDAQFQIMSERPLKIADVVHGAKLIVDEKGTEAAAATAVIMAPTGAPPARDEPVVMKADHPFIFIVRHPQTGMWFFVARVGNPA